jgi:hypothetical protein
MKVESGDRSQATSGLPPVREIDLGSVPRLLFHLHLADYLLVIFGGQVLGGALVQLISAGRLPNIGEIEVLLSAGLCFFIGFRNVGVIVPSHWIEAAIALAWPAIVFLSLAEQAAVGSFATLDQQVQDQALINSGFLGVASLLGWVTALRLIFAKFGPAHGHFSSWVSGVNARAVAAAVKVKVPVINRRRGLLFAACGVLVLLALAMVTQAVPTSLQKPLMVPNYLVSAFWLALLLRARSDFQQDAGVVLEADRRKPVLMLRSFEDDQRADLLSIWETSQRILLDYSIETRLAGYFGRFGPFIAAGSPRDKVPVIGAARARLPTDRWQDTVVGWMAAAAVIVVQVGKTKSVTWELGRLIEGNHLHKVILLLRPGRWVLRLRRDIRLRLDHLREPFAGTPWSGAFAAIACSNTVRAVSFASDGALVVIRSKSLSFDVYHVATLMAHDLMLQPAARDKPSEKGSLVPWSRPLIAAGVSLAVLAAAPIAFPRLAMTLCDRSDTLCALTGQPMSLKALRLLAQRVDDAGKAAEAFVTLAKDSSTTGNPPRETDPSTKPLLDLVFDTSVLKTDTVFPVSAGQYLAKWSQAIVKVGSIYLLAGSGVSDLLANSSNPNVTEKATQNTARFAPEIGRFFDASLWVAGATAEVYRSFVLTTSNTQLEEPHFKSGLTQIRSGIANQIYGAITAFATPGLTDHFRRERLPALAAIGSKAAKFLLPADLKVLSDAATEVGAQMIDPNVKAGLESLAAALAAK